MNWIRSALPNADQILKGLDPYLTALGDQFGEFGQEMHGIYSVINETYPGHMSFGELVLLNIFYDVTAGCTSIVGSSANPYFCSKTNTEKYPPSAPPSPNVLYGCASADEPKLIHGRNLDFPIPGLPNITAIVHFKKGGAADSPEGEVVLRGVTYMGYVGILTGYRPGGWSVSVDQRDVHKWNNQTELPIIDNVISVLMGGQSLGTFLRKSLLEIPTYSQAVSVLSTTRLVAPVYLIVGGLTGDEGAIITRAREGVDNSGGANRGTWSINWQNREWYRAQTNDDNWLPARDDRRETAYMAMERVGPYRLNQTTILEVMATPNVYNQWTTFTAYMSPAFDFIHCHVTHRYKTTPNEKYLRESEPFWQRFVPVN